MRLIRKNRFADQPGVSRRGYAFADDSVGSSNGSSSMTTVNGLT
jgi:hypothetical protein